VGKESKYPVVTVASTFSQGFKALKWAGHVRQEKALSIL